MRVSSPDLAKSLATRLNGALPEGFRLDAEDARLKVQIHGAWDATLLSLEIVEDETRTLAERLETAVESILSSLQDSVSEHLRLPWPSADGRKMAEPGVCYGGGAIHLWYGKSEEAAVLTVAEIPLTEIMRES